MVKLGQQWHELSFHERDLLTGFMESIPEQSQAKVLSVSEGGMNITKKIIYLIYYDTEHTKKLADFVAGVRSDIFLHLLELCNVNKLAELIQYSEIQRLNSIIEASSVQKFSDIANTSDTLRFSKIINGVETSHLARIIDSISTSSVDIYISNVYAEKLIFMWNGGFLDGKLMLYMKDADANKLSRLFMESADLDKLVKVFRYNEHQYNFLKILHNIQHMHRLAKVIHKTTQPETFSHTVDALKVQDIFIKILDHVQEKHLARIFDLVDGKKFALLIDESHQDKIIKFLQLIQPQNFQQILSNISRIDILARIINTTHGEKLNTLVEKTSIKHLTKLIDTSNIESLSYIINNTVGSKLGALIDGVKPSLLSQLISGANKEKLSYIIDHGDSKKLKYLIEQTSPLSKLIDLIQQVRESVFVEKLNSASQKNLKAIAHSGEFSVVKVLGSLQMQGDIAGLVEHIPEKRLAKIFEHVDHDKFSKLFHLTDQNKLVTFMSETSEKNFVDLLFYTTHIEWLARIINFCYRKNFERTIDHTNIQHLAKIINQGSPQLLWKPLDMTQGVYLGKLIKISQPLNLFKIMTTTDPQKFRYITEHADLTKLGYLIDHSSSLQKLSDLIKNTQQIDFVQKLASSSQKDISDTSKTGQFSA